VPLRDAGEKRQIEVDDVPAGDDVRVDQPQVFEKAPNRRLLRVRGSAWSKSW